MLSPKTRIAGIAMYLLTAALPVAAAEPKDTRLKEALKERRDTLLELVKLSTAQYAQGSLDLGPLVQAQQALLRAELDLCESDKKRITVLEESVTLAKKVEVLAEGRFKAGGTTTRDVLSARVNRLEVEIALERLKVRMQDPSK